MILRKTFSIAFLCCAIIAPDFNPSVLDGVGAQEQSGKKKADKEKRKVIEVDDGSALLRREQSVESLDLFYGAGGKEGAPDLTGKFAFTGEDIKGTQKKVYVKDDQGREWTVKFGSEARSETSATRLVWAMGYHTDQDYFVERVHIEGISGGDVRNVRFERRDDGFKNVGLWTWEKNPFVGTRELDGLKVLMVLLNNWDLKTINNKVVRPSKKSGEDPDERIYYISDLGATFGKTGSLASGLHLPGDPPAGSKDKPSQYAHQDFIEGIRNGMVRFHYKGKDPSVLKEVSVENARWMGEMLARLSDKQLRDAFSSGGYKDSEITTLIRAMQERISALEHL